MREIKFRALNKESGGWMIWEMPTENSEIDILAAELFFSTADLSTRGEFTGLKDINGKDIYEGDIVKDHASVFKVEFIFAAWEFVKISGAYQYPAFYSNASRMEVIGNIYENPELIN